MPAPTISLLPATPNRSTPSTFSDRMDAFLGAFPTFRTEANALGTYLDNLAITVGVVGFGGGAVDYEGDVDDQTLPSGFYFVRIASTGVKPDNTSFGFMNVSRRQSGSRASQVWASDDGKQYVRIYIETEWTAWREVFNQASILGTVSQTAGVPTGAVIQRGSNGNGTFVRFADGTQFCSRLITSSAAAGVTWTFPSAFFTSPTAIHGVVQSNILSCLTLDAAPTATACTFSVRDNADARRGNSVRISSIGNWF